MNGILRRIRRFLGVPLKTLSVSVVLFRIGVILTMRKICFVNTDLCAGGIEISLINVLKNFNYTNYEVTLLLLTPNIDFLERVPNSCKVIKASRYDSNYRGRKLYRFLNYLYSKKRSLFEKLLIKCLRPLEENLFLRYMSSVMKNNNYDSAISYRIGISADVTLNCVNAEKKTVFYHQGDIHHFRKEREWYTNFDNIVTVSKGTKELLDLSFPYAKHKIHVIHNLLDVDYITNKAEEPTEICKHCNYTNIVSVGRLVKDKGFDMLIIACSKLKQMGYRIKLIIVGGPDLTQYDNELRKYTYEYNIAEDLTFTGTKSNPYSIMKHADVYVQSSYVEAFGISIREAQILGLPVLSTRTCGGTEIIDHCVTGLLCDVSVEGLTQGLKYLIDNEKLREELSKNCLAIDYRGENLVQLNKLYQII